MGHSPCLISILVRLVVSWGMSLLQFTKGGMVNNDDQNVEDHWQASSGHDQAPNGVQDAEDKRNQKDKSGRMQLVLLSDVSGAFRPGVLTCLMGASGECCISGHCNCSQFDMDPHWQERNGIASVAVHTGGGSVS